MDTPNNATKDSKGSQKDRAILALLQHSTVDKAAEAVGIHPATLYRWLKKAEFKQRLHEARREVFAQSIGRLPQASPAAVGILLRIMADPAVPASSRIRAVQCVLDRCQKHLEVEDLEQRVEQLEKLLRPS